MKANSTHRWFGRSGLLVVSAVVAVTCAAVSSASAASAKGSSSEKQVQANLAAHVSGGVFAKIPPGLAVAHAGRGAREVALTFDDGPSTYTPLVLAALAKAGQHATFFVTGQGASEFPDMLRRIVAGGNTFGDHTDTHAQLFREDTAKRTWELSSTAERVLGTTGVHVTLFRPPYGESSTDINTLSRHLGLLPVTWSVDTRDWSRPGVSAIVATALRGVGPGDIILMHDGGGDRSETVAALPIILRALAKLHLTSVTLPELLNAQAPTHGDLEVCAC
jgi:peptidoglycan/xylan/chitin deacetylase (PgdA/CDA1 family)